MRSASICWRRRVILAPRASLWRRMASNSARRFSRFANRSLAASDGDNRCSEHVVVSKERLCPTALTPIGVATSNGPPQITHADRQTAMETVRPSRVECSRLPTCRHRRSPWRNDETVSTSSAWASVAAASVIGSSFFGEPARSMSRYPLPEVHNQGVGTGAGHAGHRGPPSMRGGPLRKRRCPANIPPAIPVSRDISAGTFVPLADVPHVPLPYLRVVVCA